MPSVSILIAARNEADRIQPTLEALDAQDYPGDWEVLLIDDHSEDPTREVIERHAGQRINLLTSDGQGKRAALFTGARSATGSILLFTDADCLPAPGWIRAMVAPFQDQGIHWVSGPVISLSTDSLVSRYDTLESQGLMAWTGAGFALGHPVLAQGANMAIRKSTFDHIAAASLPQRASGDDLFFLAKCRQHYPEGSRFQADHQAIIQTAAPPSWSNLVAQRLRWASKTGHLDRWQGQAPMILTFLMSLIFLLTPVALVWDWSGAGLVLILPAMIKLIADHRLLSGGWQKAGSPPSWSTYAAAVIIHPVLVLVAGVLGPLRRTYLWKGRLVQ